MYVMYCSMQSKYGLTEERAAALPQFNASISLQVTTLIAAYTSAVEQYGSEEVVLQHLIARTKAGYDDPNDDGEMLVRSVT
jgi:hypothetical protein